MNMPPEIETPAEMLQRLTNHLSLIARRLTELNDFQKRLESLLRAALWVWIVFPIVIILILLYVAMRVAAP
jgi:hypothetical protein